MPKLSLKVQLTGTGVVNNAYIYLEKLPTLESPNAVAIGLFAKNASRKEWNNNNILVEVIGNLEIQVNVHAFKGTAWAFKVVNKKGNKTIFEHPGKPGASHQTG